MVFSGVVENATIDAGADNNVSFASTFATNPISEMATTNSLSLVR